MPIYEYLCESCGRLTELMQKISDPPPAACPECGSGRIAKLVSRSAFQLKGGGWYADLYSSPKKGTHAAEGAAGAGAAASPASGPATGTGGTSGGSSGASGTASPKPANPTATGSPSKPGGSAGA